LRSAPMPLTFVAQRADAVLLTFVAQYIRLSIPVDTISSA
jgi:hypothetical protein